jgi:hypothetical protein
MKRNEEIGLFTKPSALSLRKGRYQDKFQCIFYHHDIFIMTDIKHRPEKILS